MRRLAILVTLASAHIAAADKPPPEDQVLALVNHYRGLAGLPAVKLDAKLSKGCAEHAEYMRQNAGTQAMAGLNAHHQDPTLPGASDAGAACGKAADLFPGVSDLGTAVDGWMAGFYHRRPILSPALQTIGVGIATNSDGTLMAALMLVNADKPETAKGWPVAYPARDEPDVPLEMGNEVPNPVPGGATGGYPVTLQFPSFDKLTAVSVTLADAAGTAVPCYLSNPEHPATSFGQYGVVAAIPKAPLRPGTTYTASVTATWGDAAPKTWTWSFTTVALRKVDANDEAALVGALGHPSLVHGVVQYGGMMDTATAFLQMGKGETAHYKMVSILIPMTVWRELVGDAKPDSLKGTTVDVEATPQLAQGKYLNLPIVQASQLRITR